jgi:hypothetical protein
MAPRRDEWARGLTAARGRSSLLARLMFPLVTAGLVLLLGAAIFGLAS